VDAVDVRHLYEVPLNLMKEGLDSIAMYKLNLKYRSSEMGKWKELVDSIYNLEGTVRIGIVGKYTNLKDAYISIVESLNHGGYHWGKNVEIKWINSELLENMDECAKNLSEQDGILIPGGFGVRGINGKINAIKFVRQSGIPYFGICLGMQCAVIEFSRNVLNLKDADSSEFNSRTRNPVIDLMTEQKNVDGLGGTMRLGSYPCRLARKSNSWNAYAKDLVYERHRHRYELNNAYIEKLAESGMIVTGLYEEKNLAEIIEIKDHPWFVGVQFHPEFKSRPDRPHPLFRGFVGAAIKHSNNRKL